VAREIPTNWVTSISSMKPETAARLSAVVPITNYFQHKENIEKIIHDASSMDIELILVLDQESNQAFENLTALLKMSKGLGLVIPSDSGNPGGARNAGLVCATAEWVTFWDCDDEPQIFEILKLITSSKRFDNQVLLGSYQIKSMKDESLNPRIIDKNNWKIDLGLNPGIWRFVFRRDLVKDIRFPEARMGEDQIFLQRVFTKEPEVFLSQIVTYIYRINVPNQLTGQRLNLKDLVNVNKVAIREYNPKTRYSKILRTMIIRQLLTLAQNKSMGMLERLAYLAKALILLVRHPTVLIKLFMLILERFSK
jgi:glycosyltransferase involved in cell wall biosynthesis